MSLNFCVSIYYFQSKTLYFTSFFLELSELRIKLLLVDPRTTLRIFTEPNSRICHATRHDEKGPYGDRFLLLARDSSQQIKKQ